MDEEIKVEGEEVVVTTPEVEVEENIEATPETEETAAPLEAPEVVA